MFDLHENVFIIILLLCFISIQGQERAEESNNDIFPIRTAVFTSVKAAME